MPERGRVDCGGSADIEAVLDLVYAPLYFRLLIGHGPLDDSFTDRILDLALDGLRRRPRKSRTWGKLPACLCRRQAIGDR